MSVVQTLVLGGLVAIWGWVLGRPLLQSTFNRARRDPVGHFNKNMTILGQAPRRSLDHHSKFANRGVQGLGMQGMTMHGGRVQTARGHGRVAGAGSFSGQPARKRRLQVMLALVIAVLISAVLAVMMRGLFVAQVAVLGAVLVLYLGLAASAGGREAERGTKVRYLNAGRTVEPARVRAAAADR